MNKNVGLLAAGGAIVGAAVVMFMPAAPADTGSYQPGFTAPVNQYSPETPGVRPPGLKGDSLYPPETPGARPPVGPGNLYPPETPGVRPPGVGLPANIYPPETPAPKGPSADVASGGAGEEASVG
jgi:hypothetical protein